MGNTDKQSSKKLLQNPEDWEKWKARFDGLLRRKKCFKAISEPGAASADEKETAYGYLLDHIHDDLLLLVTDTTDPKEALDKLYAHLFVKSGSNLTNLYQELWGLSIADGAPISELFTRINILVDRIKAQGQEVSDAEKVAAARKGFPASFFTFQAQLDAIASTQEPLTYDKMRTAAETFETSLRGAETKEQALLGHDGRRGRNAKGSGGGGGNSSSGSSGKKGNCFKCGRAGHHKADCKSKSDVCFKCHKPGHHKKNCQSGGQQGQSEFALMARATGSFVLDTGATCHIIKDEDMLATRAPSAEVVIGIGGQQVRATAIGKLYDCPGKGLLVPTTTHNILSVRQLTDHGWTATFVGNSVVVKAKGGRTITSISDRGLTASRLMRSALRQWRQKTAQPACYCGTFG